MPTAHCSIHVYCWNADSASLDRQVVLHLPCRCSVVEGRHLLTFTVPAAERIVVVRWDSTVCQLRFPSNGVPSSSGAGMTATAAASPSLGKDLKRPGALDRAEPEPGKAAREARKQRPEGSTRQKPAAEKRPWSLHPGRHVLVPASLWPDQRCDEYDGQGWEAQIRVLRGATAVVEFLYAKDDESGLPYEAIALKANCLLPLDSGAHGEHLIEPRVSSGNVGSEGPRSTAKRPKCEGRAP